VPTIPSGVSPTPPTPRRPHSFTSLLHVIGAALTHYKDVVTVTGDTPARDAVRLLYRHRFSQVPVIDRGQVAGLFSYRSFSLAVADIFDLPGQHRADGLSVWECIETPAYVQGTDECRRLFDELDGRDAVFVGSSGGCAGIITAMGVLRYLYQAASPFLLVAEIELSLRMLIKLAVGCDELGLLASTCLGHYKPERMPTAIEDLTFGDCMLLIGHGKNWDRFNRVFQADRDITYAKLKQLRDLRNDVFHFRRGLADRDREILTSSRDWMLRLVALALESEESV
jgi:CBS domain-containing protein